MAIEYGNFDKRLEMLKEEVGVFERAWEDASNFRAKEQILEMPPLTEGEAIFRVCMILTELHKDPDLVHFLIQPTEKYAQKYDVENEKSSLAKLLRRVGVGIDKGLDEFVANYEMDLCSYDYGLEANYPDPLLTAHVVGDFLKKVGVEVEVNTADGVSGDVQFIVNNGVEDYYVFTFFCRQASKGDVPFEVVIRPRSYFVESNASEN